ncbi:MAG: flavin reductase family protein [Rhizobiaceae bacterium]
MTQFDPKELRNALASYMTGVTVVTTRAEDGTLVGFTANSFTSVSLNPPLLLVCPGNHLSSFDIFARAKHFSVNILAEGQETISNIFAGSTKDRFSQIDWQEDQFGNPLIEGAAAQFSCILHNRIEAGDHHILIGQVAQFQTSTRRGLGYCREGYFSLSKERQSETSAKGAQKFVSGALVEFEGQVCVVRDKDEAHIPATTLDDRSGARTALAQYLASLGLKAKIGPVYSLYDDAEHDEHVTIFRATLLERPRHDSVELWPISRLISDDLARPANAEMVRRYREEHGNNQFGLYIGDAMRGEVHPLAAGGEAHQ